MSSRYTLYFIGIILCLINYAQYGITPIMLKYLNNVGVKPLSLTAISNILVLIIYSPRILYLFVKYKFNPITKLFDKNNRLALSLLVIITVSILIRATLSMYAIIFTKSIYFQIINLTGPFFTIIISYILLKIFHLLNVNQFIDTLNTKVNWFMFLTIISTIIGGFITIIALQDPDKSVFKWTIDFNVITNNKFGFYDILGLILMLISMIFITIYNITIKLLANKEVDNNQHNISELIVPNNQNSDNNNQQNDSEIIITNNSIENDQSSIKIDTQLISNEFLFIHHIILYSIFYGILGLAFEDLSYLANKNIIMYIVLIIYGLTSYFFGNIIYFLAISFSSTTIFSLFGSVSLITNILVAGIFLPDERISNLWTIIGSVIIVISITCFTIIKLKIN